MALETDQRAAFSESLLRVTEAALELSHSDICKTLADELNDMFPGEYVYICDVFGDSESGDVVYYCHGETWKAPYEIGQVNGKRTCAIDDDSAVNVLPRVTYDEEAEEDDHYAGMSDVDEALRTEVLFERFPGSSKWDAKIWTLRERFISKAERDAADASDFAGKGKSYPILKPSDVMAAVRSMGRAGGENKSMSSLKASIIRIAKRKGWTKYLPKSWRDGGDATESASGSSTSNEGTKQEVKLTEGAVTIEPIVLKEARADYEIKLIAPGKGSSAFYPKEVLQRDGPKVFKAGTHVYLNHPTAAEEAARPEGDVKNLAGVLTTTAEYHESHPKGSGLYARMKVFADHAQMVEEKASHVGMSIRASGIAEANKSSHGLPILKELTSAESVDVVTKAGAGGMILTESAKQTTQEGDMSPEEAKKLIEAGVSEAMKPVRERLLRSDAKEEAERLLADVTLPDQAKRRVVERALQSIPEKDGQFDAEAFGKVVVAEAKDMGAFLASITGSGRVIGMGSAPVFTGSRELSKEDKQRLKEARRAEKDQRREAVDVFESIMGDRNAAKVAVRRDVA